MQFKTALIALSGMFASLGSVAAAPATEARELKVCVSSSVSILCMYSPATLHLRRARTETSTSALTGTGTVPARPSGSTTASAPTSRLDGRTTSRASGPTVAGLARSSCTCPQACHLNRHLTYRFSDWFCNNDEGSVTMAYPGNGHITYDNDAFISFVCTWSG